MPSAIAGTRRWSRAALELVLSGVATSPDVEVDSSIEWDTKHNSTRSGPGGYPLVADTSHPVKQYYDRLGFDPATMGESDMMRLMQEDEERRLASIVTKPPGKRERDVLSQLAEYEVGSEVGAYKIKGMGSDTEQRLKARGYIKTRPHEKYTEQTAKYTLTQAGKAAWDRLQG